MSQLGTALVAAGRVQEALPVLEEAVRLHRAKLGAKNYMTRQSLNDLARGYLAAKQPEKAAPLVEESLAISEQEQPNGFLTWSTKLMLGTALVAQKKYSEAEPLLLRVYESVRQDDGKFRQERNFVRTQTLEQLIQLYDGWGKKDEAEKWRKKLEAERAKQNK
jgi:tetratricopeptide (TPR) repeat protein